MGELHKSSIGGMVSGPRSKSALLRDEIGHSWQGIASSGPSPGDDIYYNNATCSQDLITSYGHHKPYIGGDDFYVVRRELSERNAGPFHNRTTEDDTNVNANNYLGSYYADRRAVSNSDFPTVPSIPGDELDILGTHAIAVTIPTNPVAALAQTLLELRQEGLPHLVGDSLFHRTKAARDAGGEYLNVEFGWKPLVRDIKKIAQAYVDAHANAQKLEQGSGVSIKRSYRWPTEFDITVTEEGGVYPQPAIQVGYWNQTGTQRITTSVKSEAWFSAEYTYYLAPSGLGRGLQLARYLAGADLTDPEVLWNVTPWTWLADWVTNVGDVIHNVTAFSNDGLVMRNAFVMYRQTVVKEVLLSDWEMKRFPGSKHVCSQRFTTTVKQRRVASPYGFGLLHDSFSDRQYAILAALGLSRGSGKVYND